jgi:hypothetical protein
MRIDKKLPFFFCVEVWRIEPEPLACEDKSSPLSYIPKPQIYFLSAVLPSSCSLFLNPSWCLVVFAVILLFKKFSPCGLLHMLGWELGTISSLHLTLQILDGILEIPF